jgi:hypothetical protein
MPARAGTTEKLSVSIPSQDAAALRMRAKRLHGGNLSAVIAEFAADARRLEAQHVLIAQLGGPMLTEADRGALDLEWNAAPSTTRRTRSGMNKKPARKVA